VILLHQFPGEVVAITSPTPALASDADYYAGWLGGVPMFKARNYILAAVLLLCSYQTHAQKISNTPSTGDYTTDLGILQGVIGSMGYTRDICIEAFPDLQDKLNAAYKQWRGSYKQFQQEVARRINLVLIQDAKETGISLADEMTNFTNEMAKMRPALKAIYSQDGAAFRSLCERFPADLLGEFGNIAIRYPEHVQTMRKVPLN
jgi:hypothetical protein